MSNAPVTKSYHDDLNEALAILDSLLLKREEMETKIAKQKKRIAALTELVQSESDSPAPVGLVDGITDACRTVLRAAEKPLYPAEVRDRVQAMGLPPQKNLLASVHTILKRLAESNPLNVEEIRPESGEGVPRYRWKQPLPAFLRSISNLKGISPAVTSESIATPKQVGKSHPADRLKLRKARKDAFMGR
jgi:hypothetical protein